MGGWEKCELGHLTVTGEILTLPLVSIVHLDKLL